MDVEFLNRRLKGLSLGWPLIYREQVTSTQDVAREQALAGAPEGLLVLAEEQLAGRGRAGRSWWAPPGTAILSSLLLRPRVPRNRLGHIGMIAGLSMTDVLQTMVGVDARLKWPNDIMLEEKKLGGILLESFWVGEHLEAVILGLGLNTAVHFPAASPLRQEAISLLEAGRDCAREPIIVAYIMFLSDYYAQLREGWSPLEEWRGRLITLGREVEVSQGGESWTAWAEDVTEEGALVLIHNGERVLLRAGDVRVRHR